jgi:hypothetical protein
VVTPECAGQERSTKGKSVPPNDRVIYLIAATGTATPF